MLLEIACSFKYIWFVPCVWTNVKATHFFAALGKDILVSKKFL